MNLVTVPAASPAPVAPAAAPTHHSRVVAVDALRGFIMFWIIGGDALIATIAKSFHNPLAQFLGRQVSHRRWDGITFYDLIFPGFVFIVGVSLVYSLSRALEAGNRGLVLRRIFWRSALLYALGLLVYGGISHGWDHVRWLGVLQRIALCYLFAGLAFCFLRVRGLVVLFCALLLGYWAAMTCLPVRNLNLQALPLRQALEAAGQPDPRLLFEQTHTYVTGHFEEGLNLANEIDFRYLPGKKWDGAYDPEGLLSTLPAIATCLFGVFAGLLLRSGRIDEQRKIHLLLGAGALAIVLGTLWGWQFPVVKKLWTSSFVLVAGGYACVALGVFHYAIDLRNLRQWCLPFLWVGMNPIALYLVHAIVDFRSLAERIAGGPIKESFGIWGEPMVSVTVTLMMLALARTMYRRNVFLRL
jgi:predicted acyltransferase